MERTQIYLGNDQKIKLQKLASMRGMKMAEIIREAVELYIGSCGSVNQARLQESSGIWKDRNDIKNSEDFVSKLRDEWRHKVSDNGSL